MESLLDDESELPGIGHNAPPEPVDDPEPDTTEPPVIRSRGPPPMPSSILGGDYMWLADFATECAVKVRTVSLWINQAKDALPFVWIGRRKAIPVVEAKAWVKRRIRQKNPTRSKKQS